MDDNEIPERLAQLESLVEQQEAVIERLATQSRDGPHRDESSRDGPVVVTDGGDVKVTGEIGADGATGVLGKATGTGSTHGVRGEASNGYGLSTPDDAAIEGILDTNETDFVVEAGTTSTRDAKNVVLGHTVNEVQDGAVGATIGGGGRYYGRPNVVTDNYGTVGGVQYNSAGSDGDTDPTTADFATVGGGLTNRVLNASPDRRLQDAPCRE